MILTEIEKDVINKCVCVCVCVADRQTVAFHLKVIIHTSHFIVFFKKRNVLYERQQKVTF